ASVLRDASSLAPSGPPASLAAPAIAGAPIEGHTLIANSGSWSPSATSVAYQWQRDAGSGFADVTGETGTTYILLHGDIGASFRVHVVATNAAGSTPIDSAATAAVIAGQPVSTAAPAVTGGLQGGNVLAVTAGSWYPTAGTYAYQWQRDTGSGFADIAGATAPTHATVPADVTAHIRARVTATNAYGSVTATSAAVGPITSGVPVDSVLPIISGTVKRGAPLAVNSGTWSPAGSSYQFAWQRDDGAGFADITGASGTTYTPTADDLGLPLQVVVTATNAFGSATATTAATAAVATDPPVNHGSPGIAGTAKRTFTLTASAGTWTPAGATFGYQWQRDTGSGFADISGATSAAYVLAVADVDATVRVEVTATNDDGSSTVASAPTVTVVAATPGSSTAPRLSGGSRVGDQLTTSDGGWNPAAASVAYQWQRRVSGVYTDIAGATSNTYTLASADAGTSVRAKVTATNADGDGVGYSAATATVVAPPIPPSTIVAPTGTLQDTGVLSIAPGAWTPSYATFTYQWVRCPSGASTLGGCVTVGSGPTYALTGGDVGHAMAVRVTGTAAAVSTLATSAFTADVAGRALTLSSAPTIGGTVQVAQTVRAVPALWSVPTLTERYQWQRCDTDGTSCADIVGAAQQNYKVAVADKGHALVVRELVTSPGRSNSAVSDPSVVDDQPVPVAGVLPQVTGFAARAQNLVARAGTWAYAPTSLSYAWQRCDSAGTSCTPIPGATHTNYVLTTADVGSTVTIAATATNTEGSTTVLATPTAVVVAVLPQLVVTGAISGTMQVPQTIQVQRSTWHTTADTRYAFQWQRCTATGTACADIAGAHNQSYKLQLADARVRLRVVHTATNADGSVTATTPATAIVKPALPGIQNTPRLTVPGRAEVGKTLTLMPGAWNAATEITSKVLEFWRCNPRCASLGTAGAGSYVLDDADAGAMMRGSETATGPGGTVVAWAPAWLGPVRSASVGLSSLAAGSRGVVRTSSGVALATAGVGALSSVHAAAARVVHGVAAKRDRSVRVSLRRAAHAPAWKLRAWVCLARPPARERAPCSKAVALRSRATLRLAVAKGQRVRVIIVRARHR
ncbi:MAG: hypothetical protein JWQ18_159, partial [Conexibacter sp.]|nr:hypothetical protein [Conexibacter sp.]